MRIGTDGVLVNEFGKVLLIQRNDTRTFATPGGGVERGELPIDNIAREIREETGIIALPVRLVSLNFWALKPTGFLGFTFRCIQRGGELQTSPESPRVGFYATKPLPQPMLTMNRERIEHGLKHTGGPVDWWTINHSPMMRIGRLFIFGVLYPLMDLKRKVQGQPGYQDPPAWEITVRVVLQDKQGDVLWGKTAVGWQLPGGLVEGMVAPWDTAVSLTQQQTTLTPHLKDLRGVYVTEGSSQITLVFTAVADSPPTHSAQTQWLPPTETPSTHQAAHHQFILDALSSDNLTSFKHIPPY